MTFTTRPTLQGTFGMVSSTHWLASQSAMADARARRQRLRRGGRRRVRPARRRAAPQRARWRGAGDHRDRARTRRRRCCAARGRRRPGATIAHFRSLGIDLVPGSGPLAAAVPGAVDAWLLCCATTGPVRCAEVLEPAIGYAAPGTRCWSGWARRWRRVRELFEERLADVRRALAPGRRAPERRGAVHQPRYAATLRAPGRRGRGRRRRPGGPDRRRPAGLEPGLRGRGGRRVLSRRPFRDSSGEAHAGLVTGEDMAALLARPGRSPPPSMARLLGRQDRPWGQGPVLLQCLACSTRSTTRRRSTRPRRRACTPSPR